jgi:A/G-specific adenine glycosylase
MHICANQVVSQHQGHFPKTSHELSKLQGIGDYTAAAIAAFAFDERVGVVDGNVYRVLSRYFGVADDINSSLGKKRFRVLADELVPADTPGEYNQSIMEFGALQCVPVSPDCTVCPLRGGCFANNKEMVRTLPVKINRTKVKERFFIYAHVVIGESLVLKQRGPGDIWQGLFDFPLEETDQLPEKEWIVSQPFSTLRNFATMIVGDEIQWYKHILTHQKIFATFVTFKVDVANVNALMEWVEREGLRIFHSNALENLGKPRLLLKYLNGEK